MINPFMHTTDILANAFRIWFSEALRFTLFGTFVTMTVLAAGQIPLLGLPISAGLQGPLEAGLVYACLAILAQKRPGTRDFLGGSNHMRPLFVISLVVNVAIFCGLFLFIVPALFFSTWWIFAIPEMALFPGDNWIEVLKRAGAKVRPVVWTALLLIIVFSLLEAAAAVPLLKHFLAKTDPGPQTYLPILLAQTFLTPISGIAATLLYLEQSPELLKAFKKE